MFFPANFQEPSICKASAASMLLEVKLIVQIIELISTPIILKIRRPKVSVPQPHRLYSRRAQFHHNLARHPAVSRHLDVPWDEIGVCFGTRHVRGPSFTTRKAFEESPLPTLWARVWTMNLSITEGLPCQEQGFNGFSVLDRRNVSKCVSGWMMCSGSDAYWLVDLLPVVDVLLSNRDEKSVPSGKYACLDGLLGRMPNFMMMKGRKCTWRITLCNHSKGADKTCGSADRKFGTARKVLKIAKRNVLGPAPVTIAMNEESLLLSSMRCTVLECSSEVF